MNWDEMQKNSSETAPVQTAKTEIIPAQSKKNLTPEEKERLKWSDEKIKSWLFDETEKSSSNVCMALYGHDGTAKSGIALDCRNESEKKEGWKVIVFDLDGGCAPLKVIYHDNDPNIVIRNPLVRNEYKNVDYEGTFAKLKAAIDYVERHLSSMKIKAIVFDGLDKFLKICEYKMRDEIGKGVDEGVNFRYWKIRNQAYGDIMEQIKLLDVDRYFITHFKSDYTTGESIPDWEKKTPDMMFQKVRCFRDTQVEGDKRVVCLKAEVEKCKTNIALEGKVYTVAKIEQTPNGKTEAKWHGLYFNKDNTVSQKK